jgi:hypothetical protein
MDIQNRRVIALAIAAAAVTVGIGYLYQFGKIHQAPRTKELSTPARSYKNNL